MKKTMCLVVALVLMLTMTTAYAAVASKTTTDNTRVEMVVTQNGVEAVDTDMVITVTQDQAPVVEEITKLFTFVNSEQSAPVEYFPIQVKEQIIQMLPDVEDVSKLECNEFVSIDASGYKAEYGSVVAKFDFVTKYEVGKKVIALVGIYTGEKNANGEYIVTWLPLEAQAQEDGSLSVIMTQEAMLMFEGAQSVALTVLSE